MADIPWGRAATQLSDLQWRKINRGINLPDEARGEIEGALGFFRYFHRSFDEQPRAGATRKKLLKIARSADDLLTQIIGSDVGVRDRLSDLHDLGTAVPVDVLTVIFSQIEADTLSALLETSRNERAGPTPKHDALVLLCQRCWAVERLRRWAIKAAHSLPSETTGAHKKAQNYLWLVSQLDSILCKHTKRHLTRSYKGDELKQYVTACFNVVDPAIGPGSIDEAMKAYIKLKPSDAW